MKMSENINELAEALSALQGQITDVHKDQQAYGYKYANLTQVLELVRPVLAAHSLSLIQIPGNADDKVSIETVLMHKSGQWISGTLEMPVVVSKSMNPAQAVGSVISYARRYSITSWLGISQSDNDAQAEVVEAKKAPKITDTQSEEIIMLLDHDQGRINKLMERVEIKSFDDLTYDQAETLIEKIRASNRKKEGVSHE